jgi:hypothetical protein
MQGTYQVFSFYNAVHISVSFMEQCNRNEILSANQPNENGVVNKRFGDFPCLHHQEINTNARYSYIRQYWKMASGRGKLFCALGFHETISVDWAVTASG